MRAFNMQTSLQLTRGFAFLFVFAIWTSTNARAELVYGITNTNRLVGFDSATPGTLTSNVSVVGITGNFVGIDFRPSTGGLYGLGNNAGTGTVYLIDPTTGVASSVYTLTTALSGTNFGVDFNPVPDALRIVSDSGQNLRIAGFPANIFTTNIDSSLSLTGVVGAGYSNNVPGAVTTTLFDIRSTDSSLYIQNPPNAGTLNLVGALGTSTNGSVGFDISGRTGTAFASLNGGTDFGTVNLLTGAFTNFGSVGGGFAGQIVDISLVAVPEPSSVVLICGGLALIAIRGRYWRLHERSKAS